MSACEICGGKTVFYFKKNYASSPYSHLMCDWGDIEYIRCENCGFVLSLSHQQASRSAWEKLNHDYHHLIENCDGSFSIPNQPPYAMQAMMLQLLAVNGIISLANSLDYAGGYGRLSLLLSKYYDVRLPVYDPFVTSNDAHNFYFNDIQGMSFDTVFNSAMFEHVRSREELEHVNELINPNGTLLIHTVVTEIVPKDPDWFYLAPPVHSAFHTNKSMSILMTQWGFNASIYSPLSKTWCLLRLHDKTIEQRVNLINHELQSNFLIYKDGFVDYWK
ncbi:class I SAM-dependent methyltransferase [Pseudaeromonas sharmana]|uniref:Class I SAM-dependent methyltransferase n=1 Tax=Pseudaeromonas sharmana TaxID=328412 RepID=A0ABV8CJ82_9GAMM